MSSSVPDRQQCLQLFDRYGMLDNIRAHSFVVASVAEAILNHLQLPPENSATLPDHNLVMAGALLHDIAKTKCLDGSCRHPEEGKQICIEHGYQEVGTVVGEHVILTSFTPDKYRIGQFGAREIVYYSDKRVKHTTIVSLQERLSYIIDRYGDGTTFIENRIRTNFNHCLELENYLFSFLPFTPHQLATVVTTNNSLQGQ